MDHYTLSDLLDLSAVAKMAESHYQSTGMPVGIIDAFDDSILAGVGWQDICLNFHRSNPESLRRCQASDNYIKENLKVGEACRYKCKNGLWDIGIPIVVREKHLATLFIGQFFYEGEIPDKKFFKEQAGRFGYDPDKYLQALEQVPVFSYEKVESILDYDKALATFFPLVDDGMGGAVIQIDDVTEKVQLEEMLIQNENREKDRILLSGSL